MKVAIIPARGGSVRIPGKNKRVFHGNPIIRYSINTATLSGLFDRIVVTTDDPDIAQLAMECGAWAIYRKEAYAANDVGTQDVISWCCHMIPAEYVCGIYATAPLMSADDIGRGYRMLVEKGAKFAMAVGTEPLADAGQFYWGTSQAFLARVPLLTAHTVMIPIESKRVCDINTLDDFAKAELMYEKLQLERSARG